MSSIEFHTQFSQLEKILQAFAYSLTKHTEDAKDLFQETAFRALRNRDKFKVDTNFKAWSMTIMKNIFINNYRRKIKANTINDSTDNNFYLNSGKETIQNQAEGNIMMKELKRMISHLEETVRTPFMMHYEGYKYQEIADYMKLPIGTVKSRIFFARKDLKMQVQKQYGKNSFQY